MKAKKPITPKESKEPVYEVHGTVTGRRGKKASDAEVIVWRQLIRKRLQLAKGRTSEHGEYRLKFHPPKDATSKLLVVVEAHVRGISAPLTSPLTTAQPSLQIDLGVEPLDQSEFTTLMQAIRPMLDELSLLDVVENAKHQDVSFLAQETGRSTEQIMRAVIAGRLEAAFAVSAAAFYAFLCQNVPPALPSPLLEASDDFSLIGPLVQNIASLIFALSADVQTKTITGAIALDLIGPQFTGQISKFVGELQALRTTNLLNQPYLVGDATLAQLLDVAAIPQAKQQAFAQALATNTQPISDFWSTLGNGQNGFTAAEASAIELTLSIGAFVQNFVPLLQNLVQGFSSGTYKTPADLARLTEQNWVQLINQTGPPSGTVAAGTASSAEALASIVYARVTRTYPTVALSSRISAATLAPQAQQQPLIQFFQNNPNLELVSDNFAVYVTNQGDAAFAGIGQEDQAAVVANARSFQRVLRVAPNPDVAQALLGMGITSATQISTLGRQQFLVKATAAGLTGPQALRAFHAAEQRYASVVSLYMKLNTGSLGLLPKSIGLSDFDTNVKAAIVRDPTLATLFGSQDYCATNDCASILSPAAYLCDLLLWLSKRKQGSNTALDVLDNRRPDIRNLLLNCPNTDTELPYIDLVNELLADKISPPTLVETKLTVAITDSQTSISVASDSGFPAPNFYVSIGFEILLVTWVGGAGKRTWSVSRGQQGTFAALALNGAAVTLADSINPQWKQTSAGATAAQLSAAPEYFNQGAYVKLFHASYPQSLPYSTGLDGLRTYLQQWNLPLWQLRQALLPLSGVTIGQQAAVAAERFGIPPHGQDLIVHANLVSETIAWNTSNPLTDLAPVPAFLQAANITYESLLELLLVVWLQEGSNVQIQGINDTCTISTQVLKPLNSNWLDRAHRFLRLWLSTGYKMWELDLLLRAPSVAAGQLNENALAALLAFRQLQDATGLSVDQQLAFYQDIDIATHRDPDGTTTTSLYAQIFLNPTVTWAAPDPDIAALATGGAFTDIVLSDHVKAIQPALGVSGADLSTLVALTDDVLTLGNLSLLYRVNALAVASTLSISGLLNVASLLSPTAANPAAALAPLLASPADTLAFLAQATAIQQSGFTLDALTYLLTPPVGATLAFAIGATDATITVAGGVKFPLPSFYVFIGSETLLVTAVGGFLNANWTVVRGQQGTTPAAALTGTAVGLSGGWATTTQMTPANIATALGEVQQAVAGLLAASTTLAAPIGVNDMTITVTSDVNFPTPTFYVYIGSEILLVTAVGGAGNKTWTVARGQQGTAAAAATAGAAVNPTSGDLDGSVIAAVAANAHAQGAAPLASDVTALILETLQAPGTGNTLLTVLEDPSLLAAAGTITTGGSPLAGDKLQAVLASGIGVTVTVSYTLTQADSGDVNQTAADFALAINLSNAVVGPQAFLAPCTVSGAVITLVPLIPGGPGSSISSVNTTLPGGAGHVSISPGATETIGQPAFQSQFLAIQLFDKAAVLVRGLNLVASDLTWLLTNAAVYGGLDFTELPVVTSQPALNLHSMLDTLLVIKLARLWTAAPPGAAVQTLYDVITGISTGTIATAQQAQSAVQTVTGWPLPDIEAFAAALGLNHSSLYKQPASYDALRTLEAMSSAVTESGADVPTPSTTLASAITAADILITVASNIGFPSAPFYISIGSEILRVTDVNGGDNTVWAVSRHQQGTTAAPAPLGAAVTQTLAAQLVSWGAVPTGEESAESLAASALGTLKAQQATSDAWLALAPTLMNPIRQNRSTALQSYLIAQRSGSAFIYMDDAGAPDADALFNYFLIDVQTSSCQVTSRVVQAYIAVQIFVERCRMNLESDVVIDLTKDDAWDQWEWMSRYRIWEANREVFLYPENWLIESQRPNRTEIYQTFEQEVHQGQSTADYFETVVLNYIDRLDGLAHLLVTGTCEDPGAVSEQDEDSPPPSSGPTIYVVARTLADPPVFYLRSFAGGAWSGWAQIPLDIKAHQAIPVIYRGRVCLFWLDVKASNEPQQQLGAAQASPTPPNQGVDRYVTLGIYFSIFRNGSWAPAQTSKGKLFDKPLLTSNVISSSGAPSNSNMVGDNKTVEALYTLKVVTPPTTAGYGANLFIDLFRLGTYTTNAIFGIGIDGSPAVQSIPENINPSEAVHIGRAVFDGRFSDLELSNLAIFYTGPISPSIADDPSLIRLLSHAQQVYGPDAQPLIPLTSPPDPDLTGDSGLVPQAGTLGTSPADPTQGSSQTFALDFTAASSLEQYVGPLLNAAPVPLRIVGPDTDLNFKPTSYFFFQDNRRCYWVESLKYYQNGKTWSTTVPKDPATAPYFLGYDFHTFYHPFTRLFWNQLAGGDFDLLYDPNLQQVPDTIDPSYSDVFSFQSGYQPTNRVQWDLADANTTLASDITTTSQTIEVTNNIAIPLPPFYVHIGSEILRVKAVGGTNNTEWKVDRAQQGTSATPAPSGAAVTPTTASQDRQFLDFSTSGAFSVYHWELFYHIPLYIAQLLSQNQQFEDAQTWFQYIFNPTRQGSDPVPQRFWIPKPLHNLTSGEILDQQINNLLLEVNEKDTSAVNEVNLWRNDPFNPFVLADMRSGVPYMKSTVMSYLDNLIAWGDNLFSTESREALSEATLLYVIAQEMLGPTPVAVTPPPHADESFAQLQPSLDAFANAMVEIENVIGGAGGSGGAGNGKKGGVPGPETFYFTIPSNPQLLAYWSTVADRLYKLRNCQTIAGAPLQLALFDAPIDPGLLIAAQAAGVDLASVLNNLGASLPNYRFTTLYPYALDFVNAVRAYGASLQAALAQVDAGALALLQQTTQQQLLSDGSDVLDWQVQQAQSNIDALNETLALATQKQIFNSGQDTNAAEWTGMAGKAAAAVTKTIATAMHATATVVYLLPEGTAGVCGAGGTPVAHFTVGGKNAGDSSKAAGLQWTNAADILDAAATVSTTIGGWQQRQDNWTEAATEANIQITQTNIQLAGAQLALQIAQQNQTLHQEQIDNIQKQVDFLNNKFTSDSLYDWMVSSLSTTYFKSYQLAYQLCQQLERCYQFELGIPNSSFIQFGYWDSLYMGLLSGENLNHDLRRMQASYLQQNARRFELSRYVSLASFPASNPNYLTVLEQLLVTGSCGFNLPESLFDNDYPGHYNRRLTRVSLTVVYPNPGKFDNVKATLILVANQVRTSTDASAGYSENPMGSDPRFVYNYAAVPQKIATGNAQDDPGLFITTISSNITDLRYLPFENAGAVSSWNLSMPQLNNEIDLSTVGDVVLHLYYTAVDGGAGLQAAAQANNIAHLPTSGVKVFSAQNDFVAPPASGANAKPVAPWQAFLYPATSGANQVLTLLISPSKFPAWTRGKTISVTSLTVLAIAWPPGTFILVPQAPLPTPPITMTPVAVVSEPTVVAATLSAPGTLPATWSFQMQQKGVSDFVSLTQDTIGDILLLVSYQVS
jgi:Tc toxin complex TcA C-terminal TcB-binding domain/Neuraminidase-like domain/Salmonella virulence plasmid 28.1kDa A protein